MNTTVALVLGALIANGAFVEGFVLWGDGCDITPVGHCNGKEFNFRKQLCCGDQLYPRETGTECCCSWKILDTAKEKCCHGFVIQRQDECLTDPVKHGKK